jgi:ABC-type sugar transport system ATPase subunit
MNNAVEMIGICKDFLDVRVLDSVDIKIEPGTVHAVVGENGAGKSTLCKILAGFYSRSGGGIEVCGYRVGKLDPRKAIGLGITMMYQDANLAPLMTAAENIMLGQKLGLFINPNQLVRRAEEILASAGFDVNVQIPVSQLSAHEKQLVEIAKAISLDTRVLIMDEASAALSIPEKEHLFAVIRKLMQQGVAIVYVTHILPEVFELADYVTVLRNGKNVGTRKISEVTPDEVIEMMVGHKLTRAIAEHGQVGKEVLRLENVSNLPEVRGVSLKLYEGEILGIGGLAGSGQRELARVIFGADRMDTGEMYVLGEKVAFKSPSEAMKCGIGLVPRDRKGEALVPRMNLGHNIELPSLPSITKLLGIIDPSQERAMIQNQIKLLDIVPAISSKVMEEFSGGNQQKAVLAKWMATKLKILILDEPTVGVDIRTREYLYTTILELAKKGGISIILMSSDLKEVLRLSRRVLLIRKGRIVAELAGDPALEDEALKIVTEE